jgi:hypothetical protein
VERPRRGRDRDPSARALRRSGVATKGARWHCVADKLLRQDPAGNTFSTLTVRCDDGETPVSASASCAIGGHDIKQLSFELLEKTSLKNAIRAECTDGF